MNGVGRKVFTIPPGADFLATLAAHMRPGGVLARLGGTAERGAPMDLAGWRVYLPTRRAARALAVAMLNDGGVAGQRTALLPRILPLGDVDEDELLLGAEAEALAAGADLADVPPAMPSLPRLFLLAGLMNEWARLPEAAEWQLAAHVRGHSGAALRLARSLARLIDQFDNEELPLAEIGRLLDDGPFWPDRPEHRLAAQHFIAFLARRYPDELRRRHMLGPAQRRARLIRLHAHWLKAHPPAAPVIAAGSTGSLPATAELLSIIAALPTGCVVLPGLDLFMDEDSWAVLEPGHPQYGMKRLLENLGVERAQVGVLDGEDHLPPPRAAAVYAEPPPAADARASRQVLLSEALRPVETTDKWREQVKELRLNLQMGAADLHLLRAPTRRLEALSIALLMRRTLEHPGRTCTLVTPDRTLARAVRAQLARWDVAVDDSAGQPLADTPPATLLRLLCEAALNSFSPPHLAALLAHPLVCMGRARADCAQAAEDLQLAVLRPMRRYHGLATLADIVRERRREATGPEGWREHPNVRALSAGRWRAVHALAADMARLLAPLDEAFAPGGRQPPRDLLRTLLEVAEAIATPPGEHCLLWRGEAGEALAATLSEILLHAHGAPRLTPADFTAFLMAELAARPVRPRQPAHARLRILGLLEARLLRADVMILAGLNEGVWPEEARNDPWLNRKDKEFLKLPLPERKIGLSAHDFVQGASGAQVWLTLSERIGQRPAEPSRWILRLEAVLGAAGLDKALEADTWPLRLALRLEESLAMRNADNAAAGQRSDAGGTAEMSSDIFLDAFRPRPVPPPRPCPPAHLRPRRLSASRIRTLLRNPYAIFARQILRLERLKELEVRPTPDLFGTVIHAALEEFAKSHPRELPEDAEAQLLAMMERMHRAHIGDEAHLAQVRGRLERMAAWFVRDCERPWRASAFERALPECEGVLKLDIGEQKYEYVLTARADRIDLLANGGLRIIDYKTGNPPARKMTSPNYDPQLDLEAAIAARAGFPATNGARDVRVLQIVSMKGLMEEGRVVNWQTDKQPPAVRAELALEGLKRLLHAYSDARQPWLPLLWDEGGRGYNDYDHFSRWREWLPLLAHD